MSPMAVAVAFCTLSPLDLSGPPSRWAFPHGMVRFKRPNYTTKLHHKTTPQNYTTKLRQKKGNEPQVPTRRSSYSVAEGEKPPHSDIIHYTLHIIHCTLRTIPIARRLPIRVRGWMGGWAGGMWMVGGHLRAGRGGACRGEGRLNELGGWLEPNGCGGRILHPLPAGPFWTPLPLGLPPRYGAF